MFRQRPKEECRKVREMLSEYLDNRLSLEGQTAVEHHLEGCPGCRDELDSLQMTVRLLHRVPMVPSPRSFALADSEPRRLAYSQPWVGWLRPATAVAALLLVFFFAGDLLHIFEPAVLPTEGEARLMAPEEAQPAPDVPADVFGAEKSLPTGPAGSASQPRSPESPLPEEAAAVAWLPPVEIALSILVVVLGGLMIFATWQRRRVARARISPEKRE